VTGGKFVASLVNIGPGAPQGVSGDTPGAHGRQPHEEAPLTHPVDRWQLLRSLMCRPSVHERGTARGLRSPGNRTWFSPGADASHGAGSAPGPSGRSRGRDGVALRCKSHAGLPVLDTPRLQERFSS
jgi:hypothetical protein